MRTCGERDVLACEHMHIDMCACVPSRVERDVPIARECDLCVNTPAFPRAPRIGARCSHCALARVHALRTFACTFFRFRDNQELRLKRATRSGVTADRGTSISGQQRLRPSEPALPGTFTAHCALGNMVPCAKRQRQTCRDSRSGAGSRHTGTHCDGYWPACCRLQLWRVGTRSRGARIASDGPRCTARTSALLPAHFAVCHACRHLHPNHAAWGRAWGETAWGRAWGAVSQAPVGGDPC